VAPGIWLAIEASGLGTLILGIWLIGAGANYAPLAAYTILLGGPGALEADLADVDTGQELRRYGVRQGNSRGRPGTPVISTVRCRSSSSGCQLRRTCPIRWPGCARPKVAGKLVPVFDGSELALLERACAGRGFGERRDAAIIALLKASGIRLSELAGIRYDPRDPRRGDPDLWRREITVRGKGGRPRAVKIGYDAAQAVNRYLRARARHPQSWRPSCGSGRVAGGR
jgi:integrase